MCFSANPIWQQTFSTQHTSVVASLAIITENTNSYISRYYEPRDAQNIKRLGQPPLLFGWQQRESSHSAVGITRDFQQSRLLCQSPGDPPGCLCHFCWRGANGRSQWSSPQKIAACPLIHWNKEPPSPRLLFTPSPPIPVRGEDTGLAPGFQPPGRGGFAVQLSSPALARRQARWIAVLWGFSRGWKKAFREVPETMLMAAMLMLVMNSKLVMGPLMDN